MTAADHREEARSAMPILKAALLAAVLFLLCAVPASAQTRTVIATVPQPSTANPGDWAGGLTPLDGDTIVLPSGTTALDIDGTLLLGGLRTDENENTPIIRLRNGSDLAIGASEGVFPRLRNAIFAGTAGEDNQVTFVMGATISGSLRLANGVTINADPADNQSGLGLTNVNVQFSGAVTGQPTPGIRLRGGDSVVGGPVAVSGPVNAIRPVFQVDHPATLRFSEFASLSPSLVTRFTGHVVAEGGSTLGTLESSGGTLDVIPGASSATVALYGASLQDAFVNVAQAANGFFPVLSSPGSLHVDRTRFRTVPHADADQAAAPQQQTITPGAAILGSDNRFPPGRINRAGAWVPSQNASGELVADRRVLTPKEPVAGEEPPRPAKLVAHGSGQLGTKLTCAAGEYNHEIPDGAFHGNFYRDGIEVATDVAEYEISALDLGKPITCATVVVDVFGNIIDDPAVGMFQWTLPPEQLPPTPETPGTPETPSTSTPAPATPAPALPVATSPAAPTPAAANPAPAPATTSVPRATRAIAAPLPAIAAAATTPARCPTVAELSDVTTAWRLAQSAKSQTTLTGAATPGIWRCSVTGIDDGKPVVLRSLPVLVANRQRAMLTSETASTPKLRNPTLLSSGKQRISARLYARGGDAKLKTRTTRFTQTVTKGENTVRFVETVGASLPKGRYKLVVRAITKDGVSAPLVQEVTIR